MFAQTEQAKAIYQQLLHADAGLNARLEYLCNKNLAAIEREGRAFDEALEYFANVRLSSALCDLTCSITTNSLRHSIVRCRRWSSTQPT